MSQQKKTFSRQLILTAAVGLYAAIGYAAPLLAATEKANDDRGLASGRVGVPNPLDKATTVPKLIGNVMKVGVGLAGVVALIMFIWAGFTMMTAGGNSQKYDSGKKTMMWAAIGLVGVFSSYAIVNAVLTAFGV